VQGKLKCIVQVPILRHKAAQATEEREHQADSTRCRVESNTTASSPPPASPTTIATTPTSTPYTAAPTSGILLLAGLGLWRIVDQKGIQRQSVWQDEVADIVPSDGKRVQGLWFTVPSCEFYSLEMRVHLHVDTFMNKSMHPSIKKQSL
jgi:hypothetical protein